MIKVEEKGPSTILIKSIRSAAPSGENVSLREIRTLCSPARGAPIGQPRRMESKKSVRRRLSSTTTEIRDRPLFNKRKNDASAQTCLANR